MSGDVARWAATEALAAARHDHGTPIVAGPRDARAVQLDRMARHRLVAIVGEHGGIWLMGGPESWSKDELVAEILRTEFPR